MIENESDINLTVDDTKFKVDIEDNKQLINQKNITFYINAI